jgi:hypothetical protein
MRRLLQLFVVGTISHLAAVLLAVHLRVPPPVLFDVEGCLSVKLDGESLTLFIHPALPLNFDGRTVFVGGYYQVSDAKKTVSRSLVGRQVRVQAYVNPDGREIKVASARSVGPYCLEGGSGSPK